MRRAAIAVLALAAVVGGCSKGTSKDSSKTVTVYMYSEYIDPQLLKDFQAATGIAVRLDVYETTEDMMAKLRNSPGQYDVVVVSDHAIPVLAKLGQLQELELSKIPNAGNVIERLRKPPYDPQQTYSLPYQWGTVGLMYRKDKVPNMEATWAMVLDPSRQPGPVVLIDSMRDMMAAALAYLGHPINSTDPQQVRAAGEVILRAKQGKVVGFEGGVGGLAKVKAGEAYVAIVYNGDAVREADENEGFLLPKEGAVIWVDAMTIPAGAPNVEGAHRFINFILEPKVGARLSNYTRYATPNQAALPHIDPADRANPTIYPGEQEMKRLEYLRDLGAETRLYDEVWTQIKARS